MKKEELIDFLKSHLRIHINSFSESTEYCGQSGIEVTLSLIDDSSFYGEEDKICSDRVVLEDF